MKSIWAIESGEYSDYSVNHICATKEIADAMAQQINSSGDRWDQSSVEEWVLVEVMPKWIPSYSMSIHIDTEGQTSYFREDIRHGWDFEFLYSLEWYWFGSRKNGGDLRVTGLDLERVRKVFSDRKAEYMTQPQLRLQDRGGGTIA